MNNIKDNSVLIADDEKLNLEILNSILSPEYHVYMTKSGYNAIDLANKYLPDIILLDIIMPDMNGYDVLSTLKLSEKTRHIPVIFITGLDSVEDEEKGLDMDAADYIHKPFSAKIVQSRVRNQIQIVNQIRAIKQYAQNLHLTLTKMEAIVNNYKGVIWSVDHSGVITSFNGQYLKTIGVNSEYVVGKSIEAARAKYRHIEIIDNVDKTFREGPQDWSSEIDSKMFRSHTTPMYDGEGNIIGVVGSTDDVTELVKLHSVLAATEEKSKFFARMSHEMRTPLNAVIGLSELSLEAGGLNDESSEYLEKIYDAGSTLLSMVNDILDISKIEAGKFELAPVEYETPRMINDAVTQSIMRKGEKPIDFIINIDKNIPARLFGDDLRIKQILNNLLSNAFKYTKEGTVELNMSSETMDDAVILIVSVKDTGIGIESENMGSLFSDYTQIDSKSNRQIEGTGLGLSITKMMVDLMGGSVSVESEYNKGSVFTVTIPQKFVSDEIIGQDAINSIKNFRYPTGRRNIKLLSRVPLPYARVLLVDDVGTNLDVAKGLLKPYNMQVDCLTSGWEAIEAVRDENVRYNAIFMDHMMPGIDGIEATRIIREEIGTEYARTVPIIALTANAITGNEEMFLSKGFQAFISKPIEIIRLDAVINQWVRNEELEKAGMQITPDSTGAGQNRRSGLDRRSGFERRIFAENIEGLDINKGFEYFGDIDTYLQILRSFTVNTRTLIESIKKVNKDEGLADYIITVHGIKGSCRGISAEELGNQAEALEKAAKAGDFDFVAANNTAFTEAVLKLITNIEDALGKEAAKKEKQKKDKPDSEVLSKLLTACKNFKTAEMEDAMEIIENFEYESDDGLAQWLRENVDQLNYSEIVERLSGLEL